MDRFEKHYMETCNTVLQELEQALKSLNIKNLEKLLFEMRAADKVFFVGVGRVMLALESVAKRFAHLGIETHCVGEITEPAITDKDLLIIGSGSGTSLFPLAIGRKAKKFGARIIHIGSNPNSEMKEIADFQVRIPVRTKCFLKDEIDSKQPMTTLFEQSVLLMGDIAAKMIIEDKQLDMEELWRYHANLE